jgi:hypothetical protein
MSDEILIALYSTSVYMQVRKVSMWQRNPATTYKGLF